MFEESKVNPSDTTWNDPSAKNFLSDDHLMTVEDVQKVLGRSRASIYRYANTDPRGRKLNMPYDRNYLNPEHRPTPRDPLRFHASEVARFAREVLRASNVKIEVLPPRPDATSTLEAILEELQQQREELKQIRLLLGDRKQQH